MRPQSTYSCGIARLASQRRSWTWARQKARFEPTRFGASKWLCSIRRRLRRKNRKSKCWWTRPERSFARLVKHEEQCLKLFNMKCIVSAEAAMPHVWGKTPLKAGAMPTWKYLRVWKSATDTHS